MKNIALKTLVSSGVLASALLSGAALADTAPSNANWAGPYVGVHGGYGWNGFSNSSGFAGPDGSGDTWLGGAQIGNNWQFNRVVVGIEGDASKMDFISKNPGATFDEDWMSTVRARAGYSLDRFLPYVTAGVGMTDVISKNPAVGSDNSVQAGLAVGGGMDFMLDNISDDVPGAGHWFGRVEYLNVDVPQNSDNVGGTTIRGGSNNNIVRVGLNYKF